MKKIINKNKKYLYAKYGNLEDILTYRQERNEGGRSYKENNEKEIAMKRKLQGIMRTKR